MSAETTPTPETEAPAVSHEQGSEDEAVAAFAAKAGIEPETETNDEPEPADEPAEDADTEADEADPDAEPDAEELAEVEIGGKTYKVPPEVQKAVLRQADYSRKMNEVGAKEKVYTERIAEAEKLVEGAEKRAEALATVRLFDAQIQHTEAAYRKARAEGSADIGVLAADLMDLKDGRKDAVQAAANVARELTEGRNKALADARAEMDAALQKEMKGWGEELGTKLTKYALDSKVQLKSLQTLTDPALVIALDKARRWDELQAGKATIKAKAQPAPQVAKPGAPRKADPKSDAMARLRKDNSLDSAAMAFMSR